MHAYRAFSGAPHSPATKRLNGEHACGLQNEGIANGPVSELDAFQKIRERALLDLMDERSCLDAPTGIGSLTLVGVKACGFIWLAVSLPG